MPRARNLRFDDTIERSADRRSERGASTRSRAPSKSASSRLPASLAESHAFSKYSWQSGYGLPVLLPWRLTSVATRLGKDGPKTLLDWARHSVPIADAGYSSHSNSGCRWRLCCAGLPGAGANRLHRLRHAPAPRRPTLRTAPTTSTWSPGRPRIKGRRLPSLQQRLTDPKTRWSRRDGADWYGGTQRCIEFCSERLFGIAGGLPPAHIRWVPIRDPERSASTRSRRCPPIRPWRRWIS